MALKLCESNYSHEELISFLQSGNIAQKQIAALMLTTVYSQREADILLSNLTGCDGKIREAVSLKLCELMQNNKISEYFNSVNNIPVFLNSIVDINANICRNMINALKNLKYDNGFCVEFCKQLAFQTKSLLDIVEHLDFCEGKYKVNKDVFKLYWCLETVYEFYDVISFEDLKEIILRAKDINEYTIREKSAKILTHNFEDPELFAAAEQLKKDANFYVRRYLVKD